MTIANNFYRIGCDLIGHLYEQMGSIFPEDREIDLDFHHARDDDSNGDGTGHFTLYLNSPVLNIAGDVDAVKLFREWTEFCSKAADNIEAAQAKRGVMEEAAA